MIYNPKSLRAEEFISHEEILATLEYAREHKNDRELILSILEKGEQMQGITHREAAVLVTV